VAPFELGGDGARVHHVGAVGEVDGGDSVGRPGGVGGEVEGLKGWCHGGVFEPVGAVGEGFVVQG